MRPAAAEREPTTGGGPMEQQAPSPAPTTPGGRPGPFVVLASGRRSPADPSLATRRVAVPLLAALAAVVVALALGAVAARRLAEGEAVRDSAERADLIVNTALQPVLTDRLTAGDADAMQALDRVVREQLIGHPLVRVKIWSTDGRVLYS